MHPIDWIILAIPLLIVLGVGLYTRLFVKSVADFMSGGRVAGRYILAVAGGELQAGAVVFVALFELVSKSGFTLIEWWSKISIPITILITISGFVSYRFRETRAMTLAQFFELRYNKSFRLVTGVMGFIAGILNFGIIPAVGSRFFVYFLGLPPEITVLGVTMPTYIPLMGLLLSITVLIANSGGILTVMVTDCIEGIISQLFYLAILACLITVFSWGQISHVLLAQPKGHSLINPFDIGQAQDFNIWYVLIAICLNIYGTQAWQNASAYKSAPRTPHEGRMAGLLTNWRESGKAVVVTLLAVCALTFISHPDFAAQSQVAHAAIDQIKDPHIQAQMSVPIAVSYMLPAGIKGMLAAILLMGIFGGDATHLHSWGGIFIQDVIVPLRKKPFTPREHLRLLRASIIGVAVFAFLFGCLFRQTEYIIMWWNVTAAFYVGGAGAAIIGGLYWKKGTSAGAWAAMITGCSLASGGILAHQFYGDGFPLNGIQVSFIAALCAIFLYIVVSLLTTKEDFDLERMLHRGNHADPGSTSEPVVGTGKKSFFGRILRFDEDFTRSDKWLVWSVLGWTMSWSAMIIIGSIWNFISPWSNATWLQFWHVTGVGLPIVISAVTAFWFAWGGLRDIRSLFVHLRQEKINHLDDGTVLNHTNLSELLSPEEAVAAPKKVTMS